MYVHSLVEYQGVSTRVLIKQIAQSMLITLLVSMLKHTIVEYGHNDTLSSNSLHPGGLNIQVFTRRSCYTSSV